VPQGGINCQRQLLPCGIYAEHFWQAVKGPQPTFAGLFYSSFKNETQHGVMQKLQSGKKVV
jgi:hypothetical protein